MSATPLSTDPSINALLSTFQWGSKNGVSSTISYSFPSTGSLWISNYGPEVTAGWSGLTTLQQDNFKAALASWSELANLTFTQVADNSSSVGLMRVAFSNNVSQQPGNVDGWGYFPTSKFLPQAGDIWLNPNDTDFSPGTQSYHTMQHEIGHTLGLKHPFDTFNGNNAVLSGTENSTQYTIMSYTDYDGAGYVFHDLGGGSYSYYAVQASTPMLYDIAAIQFLYGANMTTRSGNDTYTFSNTQGEIKTIWDAGGIDTFNLSNQTLAQTIDLNAGHFSSLGVKQTTPTGALQAAVSNIAIAYGASIENAVGGSGNDSIIGNDLNNILNGGAGNDTLTGGLGNDKLIGGTGNDNLNGGAGNDTYQVDSIGDQINEASAAGTDTVQSTITWTLGANLENLMLLGGKAINGTGNELANIITGNTANNILNGGAGNDKLIGGAGSDTLTGGTGKDVFLLDSTTGIDTIKDFSVVDDTIQLQNAVFTSLTTTGWLASGLFTIGASAADSNDFLIYDQATGALYYDADGNGAALEFQIALLGANLALTNADFAVV